MSRRHPPLGRQALVMWLVGSLVVPSWTGCTSGSSQPPPVASVVAAVTLPPVSLTAAHVGGIGGDGEVSSLGTFQYHLPLAEVINANTSFAVALAYDSAGGNGIAGMGWQLAGLSKIADCDHRSLAHPDEQTCLDGVPLVAVDTNDYRTDPDSGQRILRYSCETQDPADPGGTTTCWRVESLDGSYRVYTTIGDDALLTELGSMDDVYDPGLARVDAYTTVNIEYRLASECPQPLPGEGGGADDPILDDIVVGPKRIWAGPPQSPAEEVHFHYACQRPDPYIVDGLESPATTMHDRLASVTFASYQVAGGPTLAWRTDFAYNSSGAGSRSKLESAQRCVFDISASTVQDVADADSSSAVDCLPVTTFKWQTPREGWGAAVVQTLPAWESMCALYFGDFAGRDGISDILFAYDCDAGEHLQILYGIPNGFASPTPTTIPADGNKWQPIDIDNDARLDLVRISDDGHLLEYRYGHEPGEGDLAGVAVFQDATAAPGTQPGFNPVIYDLVVVDLDRDGQRDILTCEDTDAEYYDDYLDETYSVAREWVFYSNTAPQAAGAFPRQPVLTGDNERRVRCGPGAVRVRTSSLVGEAARYLGEGDVPGACAETPEEWAGTCDDWWEPDCDEISDYCENQVWPFSIGWRESESRPVVYVSGDAGADLYLEDLHAPVRLFADPAGNSDIRSYSADGGGLPDELDKDGEFALAAVVDSDHDGRDEILYPDYIGTSEIVTGTWKLQHPHGINGFYTNAPSEELPIVVSPGDLATTPPMIVADLNADGLDDLLLWPRDHQLGFIKYALGAKYDGVSVEGPGNVIRRVQDGSGEIIEVEYKNGNLTGGVADIYSFDYDESACAYPARCLPQGGSGLVSVLRRSFPGEPVFSSYYLYARRAIDLWSNRDLGFHRVEVLEADGVTGKQRRRISDFGNDVHTYGDSAAESSAGSGYRGFPFAGKQTVVWETVLDVMSGRTYVTKQEIAWDTRKGSYAGPRGGFAFVSWATTRNWEFEGGAGVDLAAPWDSAVPNSPRLVNVTTTQKTVTAFGDATWERTAARGATDETLVVEIDRQILEPDGSWLSEWRRRPTWQQTTTSAGPSGGARSSEIEFEYATAVAPDGFHAEQLDGYFEFLVPERIIRDAGDPDLELVTDLEDFYCGTAHRFTTTGAGIVVPRVVEIDACGRLDGVTIPGISTEAITWYAPLRTPITVKDGFGVTRRTQLDPWGRVRMVETFGRDGTSAHDSVVNTYQRVDGGSLQSPSRLRVLTAMEVGAQGMQTRDWMGNVVESRWDGAFAQMLATNVYDPRGRLLFASAPVAVPAVPVLGTTYQYDALGRPTSITIAPGRTWTMQYDRLKAVATDPAGKTSITRYDGLGRRMEIEDHDGTRVCFGYDPLGNVTLVDRGCHGDGLVTSTDVTTDAYGRPTYFEEPGGAGARSMEYNALGELVQLIDGVGNRTSYHHDGAGRLVEAQATPAGQFVATHRRFWEYEPLADPDDAMAQSQPPGALIGATYLHEPLSGPAAPSVIETREYEPTFGRLAKEWLAIEENSQRTEFLTRYGYDFHGRLETLEYPTLISVPDPEPKPALEVRHQYGPTGHLVGMQRVYSSGEVRPLWNLMDTDPAGRPTDVLLGNGVTTTTSYDQSTGELELRTATNAAGTVLQSLEQQYWPAGPVKVRENRIATPLGPRHVREDFEYDDLHRLTEVTTSVDITAGAFSVIEVQERAYDAWGNIDEHPSAGPIISTAAGRVVSVNGVASHDYDDSGSLIRDPAATYAWWPSGKLATMTPAGGAVTHEYFYDADAARVLERSSDGAERLSVGDLYERSTTASGAISHRFRIGGPAGIAAEISKPPGAGMPGNAPATDETVATAPGRVFYLHDDAQGTLNFVSDRNGKLAQTTLYDAWGAPRPGIDDLVSFANTNNINLGYTGHAAVLQGDKTNMRGRMYDHVLNRMASADPYLSLASTQGANRYSYVRNDPATLIDPSGYWPTGGYNPCDHVSGFGSSGCDTYRPEDPWMAEQWDIYWFGMGMNLEYIDQPVDTGSPELAALLQHRDYEPYRAREGRKWGDRVASMDSSEPSTAWGWAQRCWEPGTEGWKREQLRQMPRAPVGPPSLTPLPNASVRAMTEADELAAREMDQLRKALESDSCSGSAFCHAVWNRVTRPIVMALRLAACAAGDESECPSDPIDMLMGNNSLRGPGMAGARNLADATKGPVLKRDLTKGPHAPDTPIGQVIDRAYDTRQPQGRWLSRDAAERAAGQADPAGIRSVPIRPGDGIVVTPLPNRGGVWLREADRALTIPKRAGSKDVSHTFPIGPEHPQY